MSLENKVAFVTGGGRGIGKAILLELAKAGANVAFTNRTPEQGRAVQAEVEKTGRKCLYFPADVSDPAAMEKAVEETVATLGGLHILVNNAGITRDQLFMRMKEDDWRQVMGVNLDGVFHTTRAVIKTMVKQRWGRVINITSVVGHTGNPGQVNYASAKAAMTGFTKSLAKEVGSRNITCNAVAPGFIETDMTAELNEEQTKAILANVPLGRMGRAEEIAKAVCFLAGEDAGYITGTTLHINGGMY
ncbi:MAG: 3-oxoacyl-ACP reductase FabG [Deltaproteobacteria bacterium]|nr:3-oxoacyl-ACP reductase FabG [Deltaproteobacteria bacterium]MDH4122038.1 3-oxoacyl-ACP reductase FabG [Deltaproteobacteria bacterium]